MAPPKGRRQNQQASDQQAAEAALELVSESDEEVEEEGGTHVGGIYIPPAPPAVCSSENSGPRIIISHIVNTNFKSYAGTQVLGPFHKSFTSIVGPNGSGKSNVIDSMLFVFGYRATKIRSKKISVLIHNSEHHRDIKSATVAVHFVQINDLGGEEFKVVPGSEIVISRTANRDNTSYYTINGKRSQFKEVAVLLRKQGIDLVHNRFLILQGEVEQIAMMNPKGQTEHETGMLEYLEDIIGTARYKTPLKKLEAKLNLLNEEMHEKAKRAKILEEEREDLRGPMEEAIEFLSMENDVTAIMNKSLQVKIYHAEKNLENVEDEKKKLESGMADFVAKLKDFKAQQTTLEKEAVTRQKELDALKKEEEDIMDTLTMHERGITMLTQEISNTNKNRKKAIEAKKQEEEKLKDLEKIPDKNEKEIKYLAELAEKHRVAREIEEQEVDKVLAGLKAETQELQDEKDDVLAQLVGLKNTKDSAKRAFDLAKTELALYQDNEKTEMAKLEKLKSTKEGNKKRLAEKQAFKAQMEEKLPEAEQRLDEAMSELQTLKRDEVTMTQELNSKRASMEEKRSLVNAFRSRNKVLNFIMQKKAEGALPGVFGRLGDLGGIEPRYDCAVSTACGPLDYIITDTVDTASKCLELLRKYDVGRGNFLALEKQAWLRSQYERRFSAPEDVPRLFDLIKVQDERLKPAFYFALRDTLVAEDLSQARRVAYGATRYRVVTLEGEIIEIAGTMSGGGRDKRTGRMGSSTAVTADSNPAELAQLEKKVVELQENLTGMHDRIRNREDLVSTLTRDTRKWRLDLNCASSEIKDLLQDAPTLEQRIEEQEEAVKAAAPDPDKVYELTSKVERLKEDFEKASEESDVVQKEVDKYTAQIKAITDGRMKEARSKLDATTKKLDKVNAEITKLTVEIKTSKRNSKKSLTKIENITAEITEAENLLRSCDKQLQKLMQDSNELDKKLKEVLANIKTEEVALKQVRSKILGMLKEVNIIKSAKIDEEQKLLEVTSRLRDGKAVLLSCRKELSNLKLHQIPFRAPVPPLVTYKTEEILAYDEHKLELDALTFHDLLKRHNPDLTSIDEFNKKDELYKMRVEELEDTCERRDVVRQGLDEVRIARLNEFMDGFAIISFKLTEVYQFLTLGGDAVLDLLDPMDPFSEGVSFSVRPPKKSWKNISNLSGGEKTLSSLALVFALHYYRPSPLYVMDEIDAALDVKNVSIVAIYVKERTKNAQFIIISLRLNMIEHADLFVGIFKTNNCTQSHTITPAIYGAPPKGRRQNQQASGQQAAEAALEPVSESDEEVKEEGGTHVGGIYIPPAPPAVCSSENTGPRIIISHIVNTNFKSYAGTQVLGPFHKRFTSIVGLNESGKSNVIDSMLFVFGYHATKIRSKKISVFIHNSEQHRDIKSATVAVHFVQINDLGGEEFEVVPGSEIVISRTANHDNTSYYTINGKRSQFKEVDVLLRKQGIDLVHNRFLILQGEVEQIAMMNPKGQTEQETGMLEYLEEIIGSARYKTPLKKLEAKLNLLNEETHEKAKRAKILEEEREDLRGPMEEAVEFLSLENDVTAVMNRTLQVKIYHAEKTLENVEEEKNLLETEMAEVVAKLKDFNGQQTTLEKEADTRQKELDALKIEEEDIIDTLTKHERGITMLKQETTNTNKKRKKAILTKKHEEEKLKDLEKILDKNEKEIKNLTELAEKHSVAREIEEQEVDKVLAGLKAETQELQDEKDVVLAQLVGLKNTMDSAKAAFDLAKMEVALYQNNEKTEKAKLEKLISTKEGNKKRLAEKQAVKAQMEEKLSEAEQRFDEAMSELQTLKRDEVTMTQELHSKRASMEEKRSSVNEFRSRNKVLNFIMEKKAEGALPGVFGRLGDLGGIEPRYDCAVSTACGPLDYIVTDTIETASKCLELLRKYDIGRGNFLALEKQAWLRSQYERRFSAPENVPRLFDLIKVQDERLKPAFYFALRDTLVAEDLSQARRVADGATRCQVVTLEGEIVEIAGTMSGGGRDKRTGRMGSSAAVTTDSNPAELDQLEKKVVELQENLTGMHDRIRNRENLVSTLTTRDTRKWRLDLNSASAEIKDLLQDAPTLDRRIEEQEEAVKAAAPDPDKVHELTSKVERLKEEFEKASREFGVVQKEVDKYTAQIKAITDRRMKEAQSKLNATTKKLDKVNAETTKLTIEIKTSKRNSKKSLTEIENITTEITEAENLLSSCDEQLQKLMQDSKELDKKREEVLARIKTEEVAIKQVRAKVADMLKEVNIIKSAKIDEEQKLQEVTSRLGDGKAVLLGYRKELSDLKLHQIPFRAPVSPLVTYTTEEILAYDEQKLELDASTFHDLLKQHNPDLTSIDEFNEKDELYKMRMEELEDACEQRDEVRQWLDDLRVARLNEFMEGFAIITFKLTEVYKFITLGGDAELDLLDSMDPFSEGVSFSVRPPKKSWKNISNLSGGEKTQASLALLFALHYYRPSPLYFMDEIDSALDSKNVSILALYIKERTKNAQFIIISLRLNMIEHADLFVGIFKTNNCTQSHTITPAIYGSDT